MAKKKHETGSDGEGTGAIIDIPFHEAARKRYLNYALSVITSRALPDVRDGLKPVQRRILYTMHHDMHLRPDAKPSKCAGVVGTVLGRYHPHGDTAVYDALVRMAQSWSLRYPLVDGHGNFGSIDGDPPAAYRYTEARLRPIAAEVLEDLGKDTVDFRDNFDGNYREPCVLPARLPQLLINGTSGIAVGLATNIPPHNLREVAQACVALIEDRSLSVSGLLKYIKGPDFPVGGQVLNSRAELRKIYEEGQGSIRVRGEYEVEEAERGAQRIIVKSIPYQTETDKLVQQIAEVIISRKVPQMVDVRNESTEKDGVRIVIELKRESDPALVMAYLYKNTPLQASFGLNLNCLVPVPSPLVPPEGTVAHSPAVPSAVSSMVSFPPVAVPSPLSPPEGTREGAGASSPSIAPLPPAASRQPQAASQGAVAHSPPGAVSSPAAGPLAPAASRQPPAGGEKPGLPPVPRRLDLRSMLVYFLDFRFEVVERRFRYELRLLKERIHILEGFRKIFDALGEAIRIIRASDGKKEAAGKLMERFKLDGTQAEAILELKLYKLARLEIKGILEELREKRQAAREIEETLGSKRRLWTIVKKEVQEAGEKFADPRRTRIDARGEAEVEYDEQAFIIDEDATVLLSRDGWVRRVQRVSDLQKVRLRQDDELLAITGGNTRSTVVFFSSFGAAYTMRINDIPPSPHGFGDPVQRLFRLKDGERVVGAFSFDERALPKGAAAGRGSAIGNANDKPGAVPRVHALAVSSSGYGVRFGLLPYAEPSTRAGRRFARVKEGEEILDVAVVAGDETLIAATRSGRALLCPAGEVNFLGGPGRGVKVIKVAKDDRVIGFAISRSAGEGLTVVRDNGTEIAIRPRNYRTTSRAGKGFEVIKRGRLMKVVRPKPELPEFLKLEGGEENGRTNGSGRNGGESERRS